MAHPAASKLAWLGLLLVLQAVNVDSLCNWISSDYDGLSFSRSITGNEWTLHSNGSTHSFTHVGTVNPGSLTIVIQRIGSPPVILNNQAAYLDGNKITDGTWDDSSTRSVWTANDHSVVYRRASSASTYWNEEIHFNPHTTSWWWQLLVIPGWSTPLKTTRFSDSVSIDRTSKAVVLIDSIFSSVFVLSDDRADPSVTSTNSLHVGFWVDLRQFSNYTRLSECDGNSFHHDELRKKDNDFQHDELRKKRAVDEGGFCSSFVCSLKNDTGNRVETFLTGQHDTHQISQSSNTQRNHLASQAIGQLKMTDIADITRYTSGKRLLSVGSESNGVRIDYQGGFNTENGRYLNIQVQENRPSGQRGPTVAHVNVPEHWSGSIRAVKRALLHSLENQFMLTLQTRGIAKLMSSGRRWAGPGAGA